MEILVLGPGCAKCTEAEEVVKSTLQEAGIEAFVKKVTDFQEIAGMGVFSTPAVIIDGEIKCVGRVPDKKDILIWING